jgi:hypothetical protein
MAKKLKKVAEAVVATGGGALGLVGWGVYKLLKKRGKKESKGRDPVNNQCNISGEWTVTEKWREKGELKSARYQIDIRQNGQRIRMKLEDVKSLVPGVLKGRFLNGNIEYTYKDAPGYTKISELEVAFTEDGRSAEHKNSIWEWWKLKSDFEQNKKPDDKGKSDGEWKKGRLYVNCRKEVIENINELEKYKKLPPNSEEKIFFCERIKNGKCFVVYKNRKEKGHCFAPSRFIGYRKNTMEAHKLDWDKDGKKTNPRLNDIFGHSPEYDAKREEEYKDYCERVCGGKPSNRKRKYWHEVLDI